MPYLQQVFVPVVTTIFRVLNGPVESNDQVSSMDRTLLRRGYFNFLAALVNNDVTEVLASQSKNNEITKYSNSVFQFESTSSLMFTITSYKNLFL